MNRLNFENNVRHVLTEILKTDEMFNVSSQSSLEDNGLDSINFVMLIVMIEEAFDIQIPEDKLEYKNFQTIEKILDIIGELRND